jgi:hypothetical protein
MSTWKFSSEDSATKDTDEVLGISDENDKPVLSIEWGGSSCESDPYGSYPILEASKEHWQLILAAPDLAEALANLVAECEATVNHASEIARIKPKLVAARTALSKAGVRE